MRRGLRAASSANLLATFTYTCTTKKPQIMTITVHQHRSLLKLPYHMPGLLCRCTALDKGAEQEQPGLKGLKQARVVAVRVLDTTLILRLHQTDVEASSCVELRKLACGLERIVAEALGTVPVSVTCKVATANV